jgi:hypothetical protein
LLVVCDEEKGNENGGGLVDLADVGKELEDGVVVLLEENVDEDRFEVRSVGSESMSSRKNGGWDFLENLEGEERVEELDRKLEQNRKRKWEDDGAVKQKGLLNMVGWLAREKDGKSEKRWKRKVGRTTHDEEGRVVRREDEEGIPLPKQFRLGLERKGVELNHASRARNNFGMNRRGLTGQTAGRGEKRNWIASFTRVGCLGCKTNGEGNHKGRTGNPLIMIIGDEATPMTVGFTKKDGGESCAWVLKKEHLGLDEVPGILRRLNEEKRDFDKGRGKRIHDFFIPPGSKILVSSYVHLRREGLDGYISDFNNMVRAVWEVTGDSGIEVLPVCPVVYEGLDEVGGKLISGVQDWIRWISEEGGRKSISYLAETGGKETVVGEGGAEIYKPGFLRLQSKKGGGSSEIKERGNVLGFIGGGGGRREVVLGRAMPARELAHMMEGKGDTVAGLRERESFENGVSVEGEFAFTMGVAAFCKEAVREGSFKGSYVLNVKEQMEGRALREGKEGKKVSVLMIGGSQMGRIGKVMREKGEAALEKVEVVEVKGVLDGEELKRVLDEVGMREEHPDKIVVGGPGNSLIRHGEKEVRGFCPERTVRVEKGSGGEVKRVKVGYHLTDPVKVTMGERRQVIDRTVELMEQLQGRFPFADVWYVTMFPRHVVRCCDRVSHMSEDDCWLVNGFRKGVDADVVEELEERVVGARVMEWWEALGWEQEGSLQEVRKSGVVCEDGVHLTEKMNKLAAVNLCHRLAEVQLMEGSGGESVSGRKKLKLE